MKYQLIKGEEFRQSVVVINEYDDNFSDVFINKLSFTDEVAPKGVKVTDLSNDKDGSVVGWKEDGVYKVSTQTKEQKVIFNEDCKCMFKNGYFGEEYRTFKEIDFAMIDTSNVVDMSEMFSGCEELEKWI